MVVGTGFIIPIADIVHITAPNTLSVMDGLSVAFVCPKSGSFVLTTSHGGPIRGVATMGTSRAKICPGCRNPTYRTYMVFAARLCASRNTRNRVIPTPAAAARDVMTGVMIEFFSPKKGASWTAFWTAHREDYVRPGQVHNNSLMCFLKEK